MGITIETVFIQNGSFERQILQKRSGNTKIGVNSLEEPESIERGNKYSFRLIPARAK